ncbi:hypothetical protein CYMTET_51426, partial [Cymbomonas tetramitiformis]
VIMREEEIRQEQQEQAAETSAMLCAPFLILPAPLLQAAHTQAGPSPTEELEGLRSFKQDHGHVTALAGQIEESVLKKTSNTSMKKQIEDFKSQNHDLQVKIRQLENEMLQTTNKLENVEDRVTKKLKDNMGTTHQMELDLQRESAAKKEQDVRTEYQAMMLENREKHEQLEKQQREEMDVLEAKVKELSKKPPEQDLAAIVKNKRKQMKIKKEQLAAVSGLVESELAAGREAQESEDEEPVSKMEDIKMQMEQAKGNVQLLEALRERTKREIKEQEEALENLQDELMQAEEEALKLQNEKDELAAFQEEDAEQIDMTNNLYNMAVTRVGDLREMEEEEIKKLDDLEKAEYRLYKNLDNQQKVVTPYRQEEAAATKSVDKEPKARSPRVSRQLNATDYEAMRESLNSEPAGIAHVPMFDAEVQCDLAPASLPGAPAGGVASTAKEAGRSARTSRDTTKSSGGKANSKKAANRDCTCGAADSSLPQGPPPLASLSPSLL